MTTAHTAGVDPAEFFGDAAMQDPYPLYDRLRADGPVHRVGDSDFYLVCGWDAIEDAVARVDEFSANLTAGMLYSDGTLSKFPMGDLDGPVQVLATADDPHHAVHRRMLIPQLAAKRIRATEPFIAETFERLLAQNLRDGRVEWMSAVANRLPMMVVTRLIGVPDSDVDHLIPKAYASVQMLDGIADADKLAASGTAAMELSGYIFEQFRRTIEEGAQDNLLGDMATAHANGVIDQVTAAVIMVILFSAGGESTASLLGSAVGSLADRPEIQQGLRDDPQLLGPFVEECLRFESPFRGHYRHVRVDTELAGVPLRANSRLLLLWGAANRDAAHFDSPGEFRLDRPAKGHISFGKGVHFCVGAALARLEATTVLRLLLDRTVWIEAAEVGPWLSSILVRRRSRLVLGVRS